MFQKQEDKFTQICYSNNMVYSMSGFGRASAHGSDRAFAVITIEIKSVNSKSCDIAVRTSSRYGFLEDWMKRIVRETLVRGKIDISLHISGAAGTVLSLDHDLLDRYDQLLRTVEKRYRLRRTKDASRYLALEGALVQKREDIDEDGVRKAVEPVLMRAMESLLAMRSTEGVHLSADIAKKTSALEECLSVIEAERPRMVQERYETMKDRIEKLIGDKVDEKLLLEEAALFAEKVDIEEEVVRIRAHLAHIRSLLESEEPIGRKLDFISQELLRETNTIGSKSPDEAIVATVIEMKSVIDRIKEQVQNIL